VQASFFGALVFRHLLDALATSLEPSGALERSASSNSSDEPRSDHAAVAMPYRFPDGVTALLSLVQQLLGGEEALREFAVEPAASQPDLPPLFAQLRLLLGRATPRRARLISLAFYACVPWLSAASLFRVGVPGQRVVHGGRLARDLAPLLQRSLSSGAGMLSLPPASLVRHLIAALLSQLAHDEKQLSAEDAREERRQVRGLLRDAPLFTVLLLWDWLHVRELVQRRLGDSLSRNYFYVPMVLSSVVAQLISPAMQQLEIPLQSHVEILAKHPEIAACQFVRSLCAHIARRIEDDPTLESTTLVDSLLSTMRNIFSYLRDTPSTSPSQDHPRTSVLASFVVSVVDVSLLLLVTNQEPGDTLPLVRTARTLISPSSERPATQCSAPSILDCASSESSVAESSQPFIFRNGDLLEGDRHRISAVGCRLVGRA